VAPLPAVPADRRSGLPARLGVAAVIGVLTGVAALIAGTLVPAGPVGVDCQPQGAVGCAIGAPITGFLLGALRRLLVVAVVAMVVGGVLSGLAGRFAGVRLGVAPAALWPVALWVIASLLQPFGVTIRLSGLGVPCCVALSFALVAALTAPQVKPAGRLIATGAVVLAVIIARGGALTGGR
jgi:hypothetical protein